jgi:hypothetical protein
MTLRVGKTPLRNFFRSMHVNIWKCDRTNAVPRFIAEIKICPVAAIALFNLVPPSQEQLQADKSLSKALALDLKIAAGPGFDHPDAMSDAFGPCAKHLPPLETIPASEFAEVFKNLRPGEYHNVRRIILCGIFS